MNVAFITKLGWKLCTEINKSWVQLVRSKYLHGRPIPDFQRTTKSSSWIWNGIKKCKASLDRGLCYRVGQNSLVKIRTDPWIPDLLQFKLPDDTYIPDEICRIGDLMNGDKIRWNIELIRSIYPSNICRLIISIPII